MKRQLSDVELTDGWSLNHDEFELLKHRTAKSRLAFAAMLKFFQLEGRFPGDKREVPGVALEYLADQLDVPVAAFQSYNLTGRTAKRDRESIRDHLGFRRITVDDSKTLTKWLKTHVFPFDHKPEHVHESAVSWCRTNKIEPPTPQHLERIVGSASSGFEQDFFSATLASLPTSCQSAMDELLEVSDDAESENEATPFAELRLDPGRPSLESGLNEIAKLQRIERIDLPDGLFESVANAVVQKYRLRAGTEPPRELRRHPKKIRYTLVASFCLQRKKEVIDGLVDLLIQVVHRIGVRSERKVVKTLMEDLKRVHGKTAILFRIAEAAVENPEGTIKDILYPVAGEQTLKDLVREFKATGSAYQKEVHSTIRSSYGNHYRRMLPEILDALEFRSNNALHRPVIEALEFLKAHRDSKQRYFSFNDGVPIEGVVKAKFHDFVVEQDGNGVERVNRINYEIAVLQALRERLRCKEIWVVGADRYRNPDEDLPSDFEANRQDYYSAIQQPQQAAEFVDGLKKSMAAALQSFNETIVTNDKVKLIERRKGRISLTPLEPQPEPKQLLHLKTEVTRRWPMTSLLDVLKEADLRIGFTGEFHPLGNGTPVIEISGELYLASINADHACGLGFSLDNSDVNSFGAVGVNTVTGTTFLANQDSNPDSAILGPEYTLGEWMSFRASYDFQARTVTGYFNDSLIGTVPFTNENPSDIGDRISFVEFFMATSGERPDGNVVYYDDVSILALPGPNNPGDFNLDGVLDAADIDALTTAILNGDQNPLFDVNNDVSVDQEDRRVWVKELRNTWFGDANLDGEFNSGDFVSVFQIGEYEDAVQGNSGWADGDWDGDAEFTTGDFVTAFQDGGFELGPPLAQAVPEPSGILLISMGLFASRFMRHTYIKVSC